MTTPRPVAHRTYVRPQRDLVVAGWDPTDAGAAALRWAIAEAERRDGRLIAVPVHDELAATPAPVTPSARLRDAADRAAVIVLGIAHAGTVRRHLPHLTRPGAPCRVLLVDEQGTVRPMARIGAD